MTLDALIMLMGALVLITPTLGFPVSWYKPLFFIFGVIIIGLGIVVRRGGAKLFKTKKQPRGFVESAPVSERTESQEQ